MAVFCEAAKPIKGSFHKPFATAWMLVGLVGVETRESDKNKNPRHFYVANGNAMSEETPHIGHIIRQVVTKKGIKVPWVAQQLGCHRNNVYLIFSRRWIDTDTLLKLAEILDHDFFADLSKLYRGRKS